MGKIKVAMDCVGKFVESNLPTICIAGGLAAGAATVYFAVTGRDKQKDLEEAHEGEMTKKDKAFIFGQAYWKAAASGGIAVFLILFGNSEHLKREAGLAVSYKLIDSMYKEFTNKTEEKFGDKKVQQVYDEIAKDKLQNNQQVIIIGGPGENMTKTLVPPMGQKVYLNIETVKQAEEWFKSQMETGDTVGLMDLYDMMGMPDLDLVNEDILDLLGWNYKMFEPGRYSPFVYSSDIDTMTQEPFLVIQFRVPPTTDYKLIY